MPFSIFDFPATVKKNTLLFVFVLAFAAQSIAQEKRGMVGLGVSAGATNYEGELDDNFTLQFTRLGVGVHATALFFSRVHVRIAYFHGQIGAHDGGLLASNNRRN